MSESANNHDDESRRILRSLDAVTIDPAFNNILDELAEVQEVWNDEGFSVQNASAATYPLNESLERAGFMSSKVRVTGKLRSIWDDLQWANELYGWIIHEDEDGEYVEVADMPLITAKFSSKSELDEDDVSENARKIGLSLIHPDMFDNEETAELGDLIIYPSDIEAMRFKHPSIEALEYELEYYFPDLYDHYLSIIAREPQSGAELLSTLRSIVIDADNDLYHGYPIVENLSLCLSYQLDFDDSPYEIEIDGPIQGIDHADDLIESKHYRPRTIQGVICGVRLCRDMIDGKEVYRPHLIVGELAPGQQTGYNGYLIAIDTVLSLQNTRRRASRFGNKVMKVFADPRDIMKYFSESQPEDDDVPDGERVDSNLGSGVLSDAERQTFNAITSHVDDLQVVAEYDKETSAFFLSLESDIQKVIQDYRDHCEALGVTANDTLGSVKSEQLTRLMRKTMYKFAELEWGDRIDMKGSALIVDKDTGKTKVFTADSHLRANFAGVTVMNVRHKTLTHEPRGVGCVGLRLEKCDAIDSAGHVVTDEFSSHEAVLILGPGIPRPRVMKRETAAQPQPWDQDR